MESEAVVCPNCSAQVPADNINIAALLAKGSLCSHLFRLPMADPPPAVSPPVAAPSRPSGIVHDEGPSGELYIRRRWFTPKYIFLLFFCIAWDGFLVFWYSMALFGNVKGPGPGPGDGFWLMVLFPICHVAVGVGLTYSVIAGFFNKTQVLVDENQLHVRHQPIPWWGNRVMGVDEIQEFELDHSSTNNGEVLYSVGVHHRDGRQVILLSGLPMRHAEYIGHVLAEYVEVPLRWNFAEGAASFQIPDLFKGWKKGRNK